MHALNSFRLAAAAVLVVLLGCGSGGGGSNSSPEGSNPPTFVISGAISGASGVTVALTGAETWWTTTDGNGNYSLRFLANGNYTLTPSKPGYSFNPLTITVTVNGGSVTGQNFTATACGADNWCQRNPLQGSSLHGVWGSGANDVWAVGFDGTILHWDGSAWKSVESDTRASLQGV